MRADRKHFSHLARAVKVGLGCLGKCRSIKRSLSELEGWLLSMTASDGLASSAALIRLPVLILLDLISVFAKVWKQSVLRVLNTGSALLNSSCLIPGKRCWHPRRAHDFDGQDRSLQVFRFEGLFGLSLSICLGSNFPLSHILTCASTVASLAR